MSKYLDEVNAGGRPDDDEIMLHSDGREYDPADDDPTRDTSHAFAYEDEIASWTAEDARKVLEIKPSREVLWDAEGAPLNLKAAALDAVEWLQIWCSRATNGLAPINGEGLERLERATAALRYMATQEREVG